MGTSTNAYLAFGINLGEELPDGLLKHHRHANDDDDGSFEWDAFLGSLSGIPEPEGEDYDALEWPEYWAKQRAFVAAFPLDMQTHCSGECPMYFLCVSGTKVMAYRGDAVSVSTPEVAPERIAAMREFCDKYGIEWQEPSWQIFSL